MGKYYKNDFSRANGSISEFKNITTSIDSVKNQISDYIYDIVTKTKIEGYAVCTIAGRFNTFKDELDNLSTSINSLCETATGINNSIVSAFTSKYSEISSDHLTELRTKIESARHNVRYASSRMHSINPDQYVDDIAERNYWYNKVQEYKNILTDLETEYKEVKECYDNIKALDSSSI